MTRTVRVVRESRLGATLGALLIAIACAGCGESSTEPSIGTSRGNDQPPPRMVEWGEPTNKQPEGVVILLHGGGWQPNRSAFEQEMPLARTMQRRGYATVVVGYNAGARGFREIEGVYAEVRDRYPDLPVCAHGISAGGNLALMLATREPGLDCVVDLVGPTDLTSLAEQGGAEASQLAADAFGEDDLAKYSPVRYVDQIRADVLILLAETDPVIPVAQGAEFERALPSAKLTVIPAGPVPVDWLHGARVKPGSEDAAVRRQFAFIRAATEED